MKTFWFLNIWTFFPHMFFPMFKIVWLGAYVLLHEKKSVNVLKCHNGHQMEMLC